jgi:uncharacterized protein YjgD (DUF1641 family)
MNVLLRRVILLKILYSVEGKERISVRIKFYAQAEENDRVIVQYSVFALQWETGRPDRLFTTVRTALNQSWRAYLRLLTTPMKILVIDLF